MGSAVWLFFALPDWYFSTILAPFSAGVLSVVPAVGIVALAVGSVWGVAKRRLGLLIFLVLPTASEALVAVSGFMRGDLRNQESEVILWTLLLLQAVAAGYFVLRLKGARLPASALSVFSISYAFFASFVASMAFSDVWL